METSHLYDKQQAADYLEVTPRYIDRLWAERRLAGYKWGRKIRFEKADLDAFKASGRVEANR